MTEKIKCEYCSYDNTVILQDEKSKSVDENPYGIATCNLCGHVTFWILKFKNNYSVSSEGIDFKCKPKLRTMKVWFNAISPWMYEQMSASCEKTGQNINEMVKDEVSDLYGSRIGAPLSTHSVIAKYTVDRIDYEGSL